MANKNLDAVLCITFNGISTRENIVSGENIKTSFGKINKYFNDLSDVAFTGNYANLSGTPVIDNVINSTSNNAVENQAVYNYVNSIVGDINTILEEVL